MAIWHLQGLLVGVIIAVAAADQGHYGAPVPNYVNVGANDMGSQQDCSTATRGHRARGEPHHHVSHLSRVPPIQLPPLEKNSSTVVVPCTCIHAPTTTAALQQQHTLTPRKHLFGPWRSEPQSPCERCFHLPLPPEYTEDATEMNATVINWTSPTPSNSGFPDTLSDPKGGWVNVTFSNVQFPRDSDWIAMYGQHVDLTAFKTPIKFKYAYNDYDQSNPLSWKCHGSNQTKANELCQARHGKQTRCRGGFCTPAHGNAEFYVVNHRSDYRFVYITGNSEFPEIVAQSNSISFENYNTPVGGHLHVVGDGRDPTVMGFAWTCNNTNLATATTSKTSVVKYDTVSCGGNASKYYFTTKETDVRNYTKDEMCDKHVAPAGRQGWYAPGMLLNTTLTGLTPGQRYYYVFGDETYNQWSDEFSFVAPPRIVMQEWDKAKKGKGKGKGTGKGKSTGLRYEHEHEHAYGQQHATHVVTFGDMGNAPRDGSWQHSFDFNNKGEQPSLNTTDQIDAYVHDSFYHHRTGRKVERSPVDLVLDIGDIAYSVGYLSEWDAFLAQIQNVSGAVPWPVEILRNSTFSDRSNALLLRTATARILIPAECSGPNSHSR